MQMREISIIFFFFYRHLKNVIVSKSLLKKLFQNQIQAIQLHTFCLLGLCKTKQLSFTQTLQSLNIRFFFFVCTRTHTDIHRMSFYSVSVVTQPAVTDDISH